MSILESFDLSNKSELFLSFAITYRHFPRRIFLDAISLTIEFSDIETRSAVAFPFWTVYEIQTWNSNITTSNSLSLSLSREFRWNVLFALETLLSRL